jgi:hypothetical protein
MALPLLLKYVYNNGTDEVIRRGKKINSLKYVELVEHDELATSVVLRVRDDSYPTWYKVHIDQYKNEKSIAVRCSCAYNLNDLCRHRVAALLQLQELLDRNILSSLNASYNQKHTQIRMKHIDLKTIKMLCSGHSLEESENFLRTNKAIIEKAEEERVAATVTIHNESFPVVIRKNEERTFDTSCICSATEHPLCDHKTIVFLQLLNAYGPNYFDSIRNWDNDKNKLLALYGYSLKDDIEGKFDFTYKEGKPFLRVLDTTIKRVALMPNAGIKPVDVISQRPTPIAETQKETIILPEDQTKKLGVVFNFNHKIYPFFTIDVIEGITNEKETGFLPNIAKLDISKYVETAHFTPEEATILQQCRKIQPDEIKKFLDRNSPFAKMLDSIITDEDEPITDDNKQLVAEFIYPKLKQLFEGLIDSHFVYYLPSGKNFVTKNLQEVHVSLQTIEPSFTIEKKAKNYSKACYVNIQNQPFALDENECDNPYIFLHNNELMLWSKQEDIQFAEEFIDGSSATISNKEWDKQLNEKLVPLSRLYQVDFTGDIIKEIKEGQPETKIVLQEKGDYLVFAPIFNYKGYVIRENDASQIAVADKDKVVIIKRNQQAEDDFLNIIQNLHSNFVRPQGTQTLALKGVDVLKNNWYFLFIDTMRDQNVPVEGFEVLKNFRFNTAKPSTKIFINSETDWFDAKVQISFGEQQITVADVKKALANKQQFVPLADGTLGVLPEEWLKRYSLLFRMGEGKTDKLIPL